MDCKALPAQESVEIASIALLGKVAAMLDIAPASLMQGSAVPRGWHFALLPSSTQRSQLRADGFAGLGVAIPELGLPRLMLIGRRVEYQADLIIGGPVHRRSSIKSIERKGEPDRPRALVVVCHELQGSGQAKPAILETQTFMLMPEGNRYQAPQGAIQEVSGDRIRRIVPDATLLFHFSALGFNAHKIHLDRDYARSVEGFPDLVVNGGLIALLVTEFARVDLGLCIRSLSIKYQAPLFCDHPATLSASLAAGSAGSPSWQINLHDDRGLLAAQALVETE
jgi:3-methylfumaryl-CoA hydratase